MEVGHARRGEKSATPIITGPANMSNQREATREESKSGLPMFKAEFPS
jgi:hypothetical protein